MAIFHLLTSFDFVLIAALYAIFIVSILDHGGHRNH